MIASNGEKYVGMSVASKTMVFNVETTNNFQTFPPKNTEKRDSPINRWLGIEHALGNTYLGQAACIIRVKKTFELNHDRQL